MCVFHDAGMIFFQEQDHWTRMRLKRFSQLLSCAGIVSAVALSLDAAQGQSLSEPLATPTVRITEPVAMESMVTLKGNIHPLAQARYDQGAAPGSMATGRMQLLLKRSPAQQVALRTYLGGLQDPNSQSFHKWLTPTSYGAQFGVADQDIQTIETWLQSQGFKIEAVPASRNLIQFSGSFAQVAQAFHTGMHSYVVEGVQHYSNVSDPQIPAALVPVVAGVAQLNDFHSTPQHMLQGSVQVQRQDGRLQAVAGTSTTPLLTRPLGNSPYLFLTPGDAATIYDSPNVFNSNYKGTTQQTGAGVNLGLIGNSDLQVADYLNYRRLFLNETSPKAPTLVIDGVDPGVVAGGAAVEALVDSEFSAALAPGANIYFYSSADSNLQDGATDAAYRAVQDNAVAVLSFSFGTCERNLGATGNRAISELWQQAAAQGITVTVASGDTGSAGCDFGSSAQATGGLAVSGYASTPYDIAVGGTDFDVLATSFAQYVSGANPVTANPYSTTALGYIPENPWNDSISKTLNPPGNYAADTPMQYNDGNGGTTTILAAGGGGPSTAGFCGGNVDANGNCLVAPTGYATPSFQSGLSIADTTVPLGVRYLPDVSLFASPGDQHNATWALCADGTINANETAGTTDCVGSSASTFQISEIGGTSASTPAFAGMLAMVIQSLGTTPNTRLGLANNTLYNLFATNANRGSIFHDITAGNISVPCATATARAPSPNCGASNFLTGYNATVGYDLATGLGSVDVAQLISAWDQVRFTPTTIALTALVNNTAVTTISVPHGTPVTLSAQVRPVSATGSISITSPIGSGGLAVNELLPLTNGAGSISAVNLPGGNYTIQAYYQGDVQNSPSTTSAPILVSIMPEASSAGLLLSVTDPITGTTTNYPNSNTTTSATYGQYSFAYVTPGSTSNNFHGNATGQVTLLNNGTAASLPQPNGISVNPQPINSLGSAAFALYNLAPGSYSLTSSYAGDSSYSPSTAGGTYPLVISKGPTTATVHTGTSAAAANGNRMLTVELDTDSEAAAPSGAITLSVGGTAYTGTVANGVLSNGTVAQLATFTVPYSALQSGSSRLIANYAGDGNYNSTASVACTYTAPATASAMPVGSDKLLLLAFGGNSVLCSALFFCLPARRRRFRSLLIVLFAVGLLGATGCGGTATTTTLANPLATNCAQ